MNENDLVLMPNGFGINLQLDGSNNNSDGVFRSCSKFDFTQEVIQFREVTNQRWGNASKGRSRLTKLPGNAMGGNLTLRRGMNVSESLWQWFSLVQEGKWFEQRKTMSIAFYQHREAKVIFQFTEAWPASYRIGELGVDSSDIEIQEIEIAYEGYEQILG